MYVYSEMFSKPNIFLNAPEQINHPTICSCKELSSLTIPFNVQCAIYLLSKPSGSLCLWQSLCTVFEISDFLGCFMSTLENAPQLFV